MDVELAQVGGLQEVFLENLAVASLPAVAKNVVQVMVDGAETVDDLPLCHDDAPALYHLHRPSKTD